MLDETKLESLLEALILAAGRPMTEEDLLKLFLDHERPDKKELKRALSALQEQTKHRGVRLVELASGYQFQIQTEWAMYVGRLWEEKAPRYSRALFETLALIAYRQPITRGEIEDIRGVSLSPSIFKTLQEEREWIRVVGHREVPGRPALYATTKNFLDYFGLNSLEALPSLPEIMNLDSVQLPGEDLLELRLAEQETGQVETVHVSEENIEPIEIEQMEAEEA
jgi:segregation and condensation protein B